MLRWCLVSGWFVGMVEPKSRKGFMSLIFVLFFLVSFDGYNGWIRKIFHTKCRWAKQESTGTTWDASNFSHFWSDSFEGSDTSQFFELGMMFGNMNRKRVVFSPMDTYTIERKTHVTGSFCRRDPFHHRWISRIFEVYFCPFTKNESIWCTHVFVSLSHLG